MPGDSQADLFPWILGGLLTVAGAAALLATVESPRHTRISAMADTVPGAVPAAVPGAVPTAVTTGRQFPLPAAAQEAAVPAPQPQAEGQPKSLPVLPAGEVWQCTVNGQPAFSDAPCGKNASIRQLKETNVMDASPSWPNWAYAGPDAGYAPVPAEPPMNDSYDPESNDDAYSVNQFALANDRFRRGHEPRRPHHERGSPDRK